MNKHPILFIKDVDRIDCAIWQDESGIYGQSWYADIQISGPLDANGFVEDFSKLKSIVRATIRTTIDHALLVAMPAVDISEENDDLLLESGTWTYRGPRSSIYLFEHAVNADTVSQELEILCREALPESIHDVRITLREEQSAEGVFFCYTHGITGHEGNCQRLFHGHRSLIEIYVDDKRAPKIEQQFASEILKSSVHIVGRNQINTEGDLMTIRYRGGQGEFFGTIPRDRTLVIDGETSIETITQTLVCRLPELLRDYSYRTVSLHCFEGIGKGAIAQIVNPDA